MPLPARAPPPSATTIAVLGRARSTISVGESRPGSPSSSPPENTPPAASTTASTAIATAAEAKRRARCDSRNHALHRLAPRERALRGVRALEGRHQLGAPDPKPLPTLQRRRATQPNATDPRPQPRVEVLDLEPPVSERMKLDVPGRDVRVCDDDVARGIAANRRRRPLDLDHQRFLRRDFDGQPHAALSLRLGPARFELLRHGPARRMGVRNAHQRGLRTGMDARRFGEAWMLDPGMGFRTPARPGRHGLA